MPIDNYKIFWKSFGVDERHRMEPTHSKNMDEDTVRKLMRLKRHEEPPEGYFDAFLSEFHRRQRAELLKRSSLSLFMERVNTYLSDPRSQGWAFAPVAAVFLLGFYFLVGMPDDSPLPTMPTMAQVHQAYPQAPQDYLDANDVTPVVYRGPFLHFGEGRPLVPQASQPSIPESTPQKAFEEWIPLDLSDNYH